MFFCTKIGRGKILRGAQIIQQADIVRKPDADREPAAGIEDPDIGVEALGPMRSHMEFNQA